MKLERSSSDLSKTVSNIIFGQILQILEYVEVTVPKSQDLGTVRNLKNGIQDFCRETVPLIYNIVPNFSTLLGSEAPSQTFRSKLFGSVAASSETLSFFCL